MRCLILFQKDVILALSDDRTTLAKTTQIQNWTGS